AEPDADYNRTVVTLAGAPEPVSEAAFRLIQAAKEHIDMRGQQGEHPRLGAVDVCPFIPLRDSSFEACAAHAHALGERVARELDLPVFFYGSAATEGREVLSVLRKGQYEGLEARMSDAETDHTGLTRLPDVGPMEWNETVARFGAVVIGARPILVAYNVNLAETDARVARMCGTIVRSSGRMIKDGDKKMRVSGMLAKVQGEMRSATTDEAGILATIGKTYAEHGKYMIDAFECIRSLAADHGVEVTGSELVGLAPLASFLNAGRWYHANPDVATETELVAAAVTGLGLEQLGPFNAQERIIEYAAEGA
ncbi:MAG TPA: glutamate formiminotransferase, partial [Candidatus Poseidoniales archaeon]|nr:glutamate formiminotransferase [Candidatus Poseidoniales archaeon]